MPRNVSEDVDPPKLVSEEVEALLPEEARAFLDAARGDRFEALYVVAVSTGLRRGELLGLRWSDIELDGVTTLRVGRQLQKIRDGSGVRFLVPKGGRIEPTADVLLTKPPTRTSETFRFCGFCR